MARIRRHFPKFVDVAQNQRTEHNVNDLQDVLSIDWLQKVSKLDDFVQFSVSRNVPNHFLLMAEHEDTFWVMASFVDGDLESLPTWHHSENGQGNMSI